jgi:hypothetical protein
MRASACHNVGMQAGGSGSLTTIEPILPGGSSRQPSSTMRTS